MSLAAVALRAWRKEAGKTLMEMAVLIGTDQARYAQYERGTRKPGRTIAARIEQETGVKVAWWDVDHSAKGRAAG